MYYIITYTGPFGFIKPWTAVRDGETYSQQFLTPSIIEGIRQKLQVTTIARHKLTYTSISLQQEQTHTRGWKLNKPRATSIINRGILVNPCLHLAFLTPGDAEKARTQHICLCRNEDILLPGHKIKKTTEKEFDQIDGFELLFDKSETSFPVGFNRFNNATPMYGHLQITGNPHKTK